MEIFFPLKVIISLTNPDYDYTVGKFVSTQQKPRAQSKAIVLKHLRGE